MIVGNRQRGAYIVVSAIALLVLSLIAVSMFRKSRNVNQRSPMHTYYVQASPAISV